jgi:hypothetical protein
LVKKYKISPELSKTKNNKKLNYNLNLKKFNIMQIILKKKSQKSKNLLIKNNLKLLLKIHPINKLIIIFNHLAKSKSLKIGVFNKD